MPDVRLFLSNPTVTRFKGPDIDIFISGTRPDYAAEKLTDEAEFQDAIEIIQKLPGEYSLFGVQNSEGPTAHAYRGITSSYDIYYTKGPMGTIVVGDHFRDVLSELPAEDRTVPDSVATDQLLFGTRPGGSYVDEIGRLGHGERLVWHQDTEPTIELVTSLSAEHSYSPNEAKERIDSYLETVIQDTDHEGPTTTMLSGGVDSTLVQYYLQADQTVSGVINSPNYEQETAYAKRASELLGTDHQWVEFDESEYVDLVEKTIDAVGLPIHHMQTTLIERTFAETPFETYYNGDFADSIFGKGPAYTYQIAHWMRYFIDYIPDFDRRVQTLKTRKQKISSPATDPSGFALNASGQASPTFVANVLNQEVVNERRKKRLRYTARRVPILETSGFGPHMHLGHFLAFFQAETASKWRHAAHANGKEMQTPFPGREIVSTVLGLDPSNRYVRRLNSKWLIKYLLKDNLPDYKVNKPKGGGGVDVERYFEEGPLRNAFDLYSVPSFVPEGKREQIRNGSNYASWHAFSYAVWHDRILQNDSLDKFDNTTVIERS